MEFRQITLCYRSLTNYARFAVTFSHQVSPTRSKTKTFIFVLEAPRDQDPGLEDYITVYFTKLNCIKNFGSVA